MTRVPLAQRPRDLVYLLFFVIHIPATLLVDLQALYPSGWIPSIVAGLPRYYFDMSNDPLIGSVMGYFGESQKAPFTWFRTFLMLEAFFQVPVFILGIRGLWRGTSSIYVLLLIYAASTATTTLPCISVILSTPVSPSQHGTIPSLTQEQQLLLLSSYVPFFLVPFVMMLDMAYRVQNLVAAALRSPRTEKEE